MLDLYSVFCEKTGERWTLAESVTKWDIILLVSEGEVLYRLEGEELLLRKGDMLYIPRGTKRTGYSDLPHEKFAVLFTGQRKDLLLNILDNSRPARIKCRNYEYMKQRFSLLVHHWIGRLPRHEPICQGIFLEMLGLADQESDQVHAATSKARLVADVQHYILAHYRELIYLKDIADQVDRTPNYITTVFHEMTGFTPVEYIHQVRMTAARDLLLNTQMTIAEIADYLGYCDQSYFNRVYKRLNGHPPSLLRGSKGI